MEQREASRNRAQQLKHRFRLDLAMYMARFESATAHQHLKNPTEVGDNVLRIIKLVVAKRHAASYAPVAEIFIQQTKKQNYKNSSKTCITIYFVLKKIKHLMMH